MMFENMQASWSRPFVNWRKVINLEVLLLSCLLILASLLERSAILCSLVELKLFSAFE
jgi:hypothetical protein